MRLPFLTSLADGKITVLLFHKVPATRHRLSPSELEVSGFEQVLDAVMENFRILPLADAVAALGKGKLPARTACITFDDGYPEWTKHVVPALERRNAHATFFVTSGQFEGLPMWNERILHAVDACEPDAPPLDLTEFGLPLLPLKTLQDRQAAVRLLDSTIKYLPPAPKEAALQKLEAFAGHGKSSASSLTADELRHLHAKGFAIGAHSITHPILSRCDENEAYREIAGSREMLEGIVRAPVSLFAYPNGIPGKDFTAEHIDMVRKAGYTSAFSTHSGVGTKSTSRFQIPRFTPWGPSSTRMGLQLARNLLQKPALLEAKPAKSGKALMIAFHFPPQAGSSGIHRTLNFVKHMAREGQEPAVLTANKRAYEAVSEDLLKTIPSNVNVIRSFSLDASRHFSIKGKYPGMLALPDRWSTWWPSAVWAGWKHIRQHRSNVIWSTYPIASAHLIGATLHRLTGLPWVADFRDPMVSDGYPVGKLQRLLWRRLEAYVIRNACESVFTTHRTASLYAARYPSSKTRLHVIENGYDEDAFTGNSPVRAGLRPEQQLWLHSGMIYPKERDPSSFFSAVRTLLDSGILNPDELRIRFRGAKHEQEIQSAVADHGLQGVVETCPPIPYREAISEMLGADLLLLFQGAEFNDQIPAKVYEYLRAERPILAMVGSSGDTRELLSSFENVEAPDINSSYQIEEAIRSLLHIGFPPYTNAHRLAVNKYSRETAALKLVALFDGVVNRHQRGWRRG